MFKKSVGKWHNCIVCIMALGIIYLLKYRIEQFLFQYMTVSNKKALATLDTVHK